MKLRTLILHLESTRTRYHHHPSEIKAESESPLAASVDSVCHPVHAPKSYCSRDSFHCYYLVGPNIPIYSHGHSNSHLMQRYTFRMLQTIQMKLILLCVLAELANFALKFKYKI